MRTNTLLKNWKFYEHFTYENNIPQGCGDAESVIVPHVWNKEDASQESCRLYTTQLTWSGTPQTRAFLSFDAVGGVTRVWVNDIFVGEHRGGYACFRFDVTDVLVAGENTVAVTAGNTRYDDINPLIDVPQLHTFVNAYGPTRAHIRAAIEKICGKSEFMGTAGETVFCGRWDTRR